MARSAHNHVDRSRGPKGPRRIFGLLGLLAVLAASLPSTTHARVLDIAPAAHDSADALGTALGTAQPGDTLRLAPGTYRGSHTLVRGVSLVGRAGPDSTILDAAGSRWVLRGFDLDRTTTITGLTIRGGRRDHANSAGGGLHLRGSSPIVFGNVFEDHVGYLGGGIQVFQGSRPVVAYNVFRRCEGYLGGAVCAYLDADLLLYNNVFFDNESFSGGAVLAMRSAAVLIANTIVRNRCGTGGGSAIYLDDSPAWIARNVLAENRGSAAVYCLTTENLPFVRDNLIESEAGVAGGACPDFLGEDGNCSADVHLGKATLREVLDVANERACAPRAGARSWSGTIPAVPPDILALWRDWVAEHARDPSAAQGLLGEAGAPSGRKSSAKMRNSSR